jgi:hypothetical protein
MFDPLGTLPEAKRKPQIEALAALHQDLARINDVRTVGEVERLADVVVG